MPSNKKRKTVEPQAVSNSTRSTPTHVYVVHSLIGDLYTPFEHDLLGIYTDCGTTNSAAHDYYNKTWETVSIPEQLEPEEEFLRDEIYRYMPHDVGVDDEEDEDEFKVDALSVVRLRHDGGLRFGGRDRKDGITVVWVERRELNPPTIS
jgi:hypothetical protein